MDMNEVLSTQYSSEKTVHFKNCLGVFQGGGCKALAFVGAYKEVRSRGVNFSEVAGTSAGSIFAALIAAGATPEYIEKLVFETDFKKFNKKPKNEIGSKYGYKGLNLIRSIVKKTFHKNKVINGFLSILENLGIYSSEELEIWLENELKCLLKITGDTKVTFSDLKIPLHVIATDISKQKQKVWNLENSGDITVSYAVRCSCTIPFYFQPVDMTYVDGGLVSNLPSFSLNSEKGHFEKILCFTLNSKSEKVTCIKTYFESIAGAIVDGAVHIQEMLQHNTYNIVISNLPVSSTGFELINKELIDETIEIGRKSASNFFNQEMVKISEKESQLNIKLSKDYILNSVVMEDVNKHKHIYLSFNNTKHIYGLFPTILSWIIDGEQKITFITRQIDKITSKESEINHERYRRLLIKKFGINLIERDSVPFDAFIFIGEEESNDRAIFLYDKDDQDLNVGFGSTYDGKNNLYIIKSLISMLNITTEEENEKSFTNKPLFKIEKTSFKSHIKNLKKVAQYKNKAVTLQKQNININNMSLMTRYVKSYKYNQIDRFNEILRSYDLSLFDPCTIKFMDEDETQLLVTPVILEKHGEKYFVIKGNSRIGYAYRDLNLTGEHTVIVASNVNEKLPSLGCFPVNECIITTKNKDGTTRYDNWSYSYFRRIEEMMRNPSEYL